MIGLSATTKPLGTARRAFERFGPALRDQRGAVLGGGSLAFVASLLELVRPWPLKLVVDSVLGDEPAPRSLSRLSPEQLLAGSAIALLVIPLAAGLLNGRAAIVLATVGRKVTTRVRRMVCEHLQLLPLTFHHRSETGDLLVRILGDVNMVRDILFSGWIALVQRAFLFVGTLALLTWIDPILGLVAAAPLPFLFVRIGRSGRRMKEAVGKQRKKEGGAASLASELLRQIRAIKAFGAEERSASLFAGLSRSGEKAGVRAARIAAGTAVEAEVLTGLGLALVLYFGVGRVQSGSLGLGELLVALSYARALFKPLRKGTGEAVRIAKAAACADRLLEVLEVEPENKNRGETAPEFRGAIRFEEVTHVYDGREPALDHVSFEVPPGRLCVLAGENGAGKSTALSLLLRLLEADSGRVLIDGRDVRDFSLASYRHQIAYVPQDDLLFNGTIRDNIAFACPEAESSAVEDAAATARVTEFAAGMPLGLDTEIGEDGELLSGGQRRRISLARAALRRASVLVLDEPLEGLDPAARRDIAGVIRKLARGRTTLVVSHVAVDDIEPDMLLTLERGRLVDARA